MRHFLLFLSFLIGPAFSAQAQHRLLKQLVHDRVVVNSPDSTVVAFVYPHSEDVKAKEEKVYYWYKADKIRTTRGGFGGKLLHGEYTAFYIDQNLKEKGQFKKGLKKGAWKAWYPNGELKEVVKWKKGQRNGAFATYRSDNTLYRTGKYKDDQPKGKFQEYDEKGKAIGTAKSEKATKAKKKRFASTWASLKQKLKGKKKSQVAPAPRPIAKAPLASDTLNKSGKGNKLEKQKKDTPKPEKKEKAPKTKRTKDEPAKKEEGTTLRAPIPQ